jgi:uncharacterized protein YndB with AHSA1/START domain
MKSLHFETMIHAKREDVWKVMLAPDTYRTWTAEFAEGSYFEGSWDKGERIRFLTPDGAGMLSVIAENRPHEFLSIKHIGQIKDGVEDTTSEEVRGWAPAFENYTLSDSETGAQVRVDMDVTPDFEQYMAKTWPKALAKLKAICEAC